MVKRIIAVVFGMIAGFLVVLALQMVSSYLHPMPEGLDLSDVEGMREFVNSLPLSAFLIVLFAHAAGALAAAFVAGAICPPDWKMLAIILGVLLLIAGITNFVMIPHPVWFMVADVLVYLPLALFGGYLAFQWFGPNKSAAESATVE